MIGEKSAAYLALAIAALIIFDIQLVNACGACGSSMNSYNPDFTHYSNNHSISFNSNFGLFEAKVPLGHSLLSKNHVNDGHSHNLDLGSIDYTEKQFNYELSGTYYPVRNFALSAILPFVQMKLFRSGELLENKHCLGDALLLGQYHLINRIESPEVKTGHRFSLGGGIKLPTGKYQMKGYNNVVEPTRQPGSGSFDFLFNVQYLMLVKEFGVNTFANYKANMENKNDFKFGNVFNSNIKLFYNKRIKSFGLIPNVGLDYEQTWKDQENGEAYALDTGGELLSGTFGMDLYFKEVGLSFTYFLPVNQSLYGVQFENKHRFMASARYVFKDKKNNKK